MGNAEISAERLQRVLRKQLGDFYDGFDQHPISEIQDLRALSIAWLATFVPEAFSPWFERILAASVLRLRARDDYSYHGWHLLSPLHVALFALTGDRYWLSDVLANLDHHNRRLRTFIINAFALVANRLAFDEDMLNRTAHNLQVRHMGCEYLVILFAFSRQSAAQKLEQISAWLGQYSLNPDEEQCLRDLATGNFVVNPFLAHLAWLQQYVSLILMSDPQPTWGPTPAEVHQERDFTGGIVPTQPGLAGHTPGILQLMYGAQPASGPTRPEKNYEPDSLGGSAPIQPELTAYTVPFEEVWRRIRSHPLVDSLVRIECPEKGPGPWPMDR